LLPNHPHLFLKHGHHIISLHHVAAVAQWEHDWIHCCSNSNTAALLTQLHYIVNNKIKNMNFRCA